MLDWRDEGHRIVAVCGEQDVGYVFPNENPTAKWVRWRLVFTAGMVPMETRAIDIAAAKVDLQKYFATLLCRLAPFKDAIALARRTIKYVEPIDTKLECDVEMGALAHAVLKSAGVGDVSSPA
jgi:hypothetical protein